MSVSLAAGGAGLGTMWGEQLAISMLTDAGFDDIDVENVGGDPINNCYLARKTPAILLVAVKVILM